MRISSYELYDKANETHAYVFRLEKFSKFHEFFLKDKKIINKWIQILKLYCISSDFDHQYEVYELIGSGHFAKVFFFFYKEIESFFLQRFIKSNIKKLIIFMQLK